MLDRGDGTRRIACPKTYSPCHRIMFFKWDLYRGSGEKGDSICKFDMAQGIWAARSAWMCHIAYRGARVWKMASELLVVQCEESEKFGEELRCMYKSWPVTAGHALDTYP